ncbi:unnamed protein product [Closterium sp. NIES-53]
MVDRLPTLRRGAAPALQKGDLPTQQVDGVPTMQQSGCLALPSRRQQCARSKVRADDWPDLHRCASVGCCLRLMSHIDIGIPTRSRLRHRDLDDVRVPPQNSPSRLSGRPGQPQMLWSTTKCLWSTTGRTEGRRTSPSTSRSNCPSWSAAHPSPRPVSCSCRAPWSTATPQRSSTARQSLSSSSPTVNGRLLLPYIRPSRRRCPSEGGANTPLRLTGQGHGHGHGHGHGQGQGHGHGQGHIMVTSTIT